MKTSVMTLVFAAIFLIAGGLCAAHAQSFSGFSTVGVFDITPHPLPPPKPCVPNRPCIHPEITPCQINCPGDSYSPGAYVDTEEDNVAALYYNVESESSFYLGGNANPLVTADGAGNPSASGRYYVNAPPGLWTEVTAHYVDFFYVSTYGYSDPYDLSAGYSDGGYNDSYWYYLNYALQYVKEARVLLGETADSTNNQSLPAPGPAVLSVLFQQFISPQNVAGPTIAGINFAGNPCNPDVYAGDNRGFNPALGSYRAFQQAMVPVGGYSQPLVPGTQETGWTYEFSSSVLQNGLIPNSAYNYNSLYKCSSTGIDEYGHAPTSTMQFPIPDLSAAPYSTSLTLKGSTSNPVPVIAFPITWHGTVTLTEPVSSAVIVTGNMTVQCFPSAELTVGPIDVLDYSPTSNNPAYIGACLAGLSTTYPISATIPTLVSTGGGGVQ